MMCLLPLFKNFGIIRTRLAVRLMVGQRTLNPYVEVRILYRQPIQKRGGFKLRVWSLRMLNLTQQITQQGV